VPWVAVTAYLAESDDRAALKHLPDGGAIINTSSISINGLRGNKTLIDYATTKGAVLALTYSLAQALQDRGIRVNCVAPGPVWTPLNPATFDADRVSSFGSQVPMGTRRPPTWTRSPRPTSSSPAGGCPATTPENSSPTSAAKPSRVIETSLHEPGLYFQRCNS
jgi:NAD(P)-dependent dehydrogenase (short-subunit alcohol dehydrogenase family)